MLLDDLVSEFGTAIVDLAPRIIGALLILLIGALLIRVVLRLLDSALRHTDDLDSEVYRGFIKTVARVFMWFGVILAVLSTLGLESIAASLGTATGFIALGVAYAVKDMLADAVAGIYLLRDEDFNAGDTIKIGGNVVGDIKEIGLRKTRFSTSDGDTVVKANAKIEAEWVRVGQKQASAPDSTSGE